MADMPLALYFPCPTCGTVLAQVRELNEEIHAGATYHCNECGAAVIIVALSMEMLADPASIRWDCHFCKPGPCRFAQSTGAAAGSPDAPTT